VISSLDGDDLSSNGALLEAIVRLPLEEKAEALAGASMWRTKEIPSLGLESLRLSDGPNGVRGEVFDERDIAACTPCGSALGATWDTELVQRVAALVGDEALRRGINVVLGPTMNTHRSPLGGRGFECFAEDPVLAGSLAAAWVTGLQSRCVAATPKHFVCNDAETDRTSIDCVVDDRALREIYLVPFERAVAAGAYAIMTGYNKVNGVFCAANAELVAGVLKSEWHFDGLVMTDWFASGDTVGFVTGGLDLEMPGPARLYGAALAEAVRSGDVDESLLDDKLERLVRLASRVGPRRQAHAQRVQPDASNDADELLIEAAAASFVLLKNENSFLPLELQSLRRIAVIGPNAVDPCLQGGGSAHVALANVTTPLEAITECCSPDTEVIFAKGCTPRLTLPGLHLMNPRASEDPTVLGFTVEIRGGPALEIRSSEVRSASKFIWLGELPGLDEGESGEVRISGLITPLATGPYVFSVRGSALCRMFVDGQEVTSFTPPVDDPVEALFSIDDTRGVIDLEADVTVLVEVELIAPPQRLHLVSFGCLAPEAEDLIERAVKLAGEVDAVVLVVGTSEDTEGESADRETTVLPGDQEELVRRVLLANPNCVVVVNAATAVDLGCAKDAAAILYTWFAGQGFGEALADVLIGAREPGGRMPFTIAREHLHYPAWDTSPNENGELVYGESVFVGYRHFDTALLEPEFCFGHGLSYTDFEYGNLEIFNDQLRRGEPCTFRVKVRNVGTRRGKDVVQVYVNDVESSLARPPQELKAYCAVALDPGEERDLTFKLDERAFSYWDPARNSWYAEPGDFVISVGRSSRDFRAYHRVVLLNSEVVAG
jgi:beta-glucosidase